MTDFTINIYSGNSDTKRMTITRDSRGSGNFQSFEISQTKEDEYQSGFIDNLNSMAEEPSINDKVEIDIDGSNVFTGYIRTTQRDLIQQDSRDIKLIGKTYDLWRNIIDDTNYEWGVDYTSNIISGMIENHSTVDTSLIPQDSGKMLSGNYDFKYWTLGEAINSVSEYDDYRYFIDKDNKFHYYEPSGSQGTLNESDLLKIHYLKMDDRDIWNDIVVVGSGNIYSRASNQASIDDYGRYIKNIRDLTITSQEDADSLANNYLSKYKDPVYEGKITINGDASYDLEQYVNFNFTNLGVSGNQEITGITHRMSTVHGFTTTLDFGRSPYNPSRDLKKVDATTYRHDQEISNLQTGVPVINSEPHEWVELFSKSWGDSGFIGSIDGSSKWGDNDGFIVMTFIIDVSGQVGGSVDTSIITYDSNNQADTISEFDVTNEFSSNIYHTEKTISLVARRNKNVSITTTLTSGQCTCKYAWYTLGAT